MTPPRSRAAIAAVVFAVGVAATPVTLSLGNWQSLQWASAQVGTANCTALDDAHSTGSGTVLSGSILTADLSHFADLASLTATSDSGTTAASPASAIAATDPVDNETAGTAWSNALDATVLDSLPIDLTGVITLHTGNDTGALSQYAVARGDASSGGASGLVTDTGGIALNSTPGHQYPTFATVSISRLLIGVGGGTLSDTVAGIADADLEIGALASTATLDACDGAWDGTYSAVHRDYFIAGLGASATSPTVAAVGSTATEAAATLASKVSGLGDATGALTNTLNGILSTQLSIPGVLGLGTPHVTGLTLAADLSPVTDLLREIPLGTDGSLGSINVSTGTVHVDLAALLGPPGTAEGLNDLAPNTEMLLNESQLGRVATATTTALAPLVGNIATAAAGVANSANVTVRLSVPVSVSVLGTGAINVGSVDATIANLLGNTGDTDPNNDPRVAAVFNGVTCTLGALLCGTVAGLLKALLDNGLVNSVIGGVTNLIPVLATTVVSAIHDATSHTLADLSTSLTDTTTTAVSVVSGGLGGLFGQDGVLSVMINCQNSPNPADAAPGSPEPAWAADLPQPSTSPYQSGRYDVSALCISGVGVLAGGIAVDLARSSVGPNRLN